MRKVVVFGNCQAQMIEGLLMSSGDVSVARLPPSFSMTEADRAETMAHMIDADAVFVQRTAADNPVEWLRSDRLRQALAGKCWVWPVVYFDGYFPGTQYIYLEHWNKLLSPLEDYHLKPVLDAFTAGKTAQAAAQMLREPGDGDPFAQSLAQLRARETDCDIVASDIVERMVATRQCFETPNHPCNALLLALTQRLADAAGLAFDPVRAAQFAYRLDRIHIAPFEWVRQRYRLDFVSSPCYTGVAVEDVTFGTVTLGEARRYTDIELIDAFFRIYEIALARSA